MPCDLRVAIPVYRTDVPATTIDETLSSQTKTDPPSTKVPEWNQALFAPSFLSSTSVSPAVSALLSLTGIIRECMTSSNHTPDFGELRIQVLTQTLLATEAEHNHSAYRTCGNKSDWSNETSSRARFWDRQETLARFLKTYQREVFNFTRLTTICALTAE